MNYAIGEHFERFIQDLVKTGRYSNPSEVVQEGLRLMEVREMKLKNLKDHLDSAIERGGSYSDWEVEEFLASGRNP